MTLNTLRTTTLEIVPPIDYPPVDHKGTRHRVLLLRRSFAEGHVVIALCSGLYLLVAVLLDFKYKIFPNDAVSRMANGFYVLYSRDPHLAAIGFVWNPGQSMLDIVPLLFWHLWPDLASHDFAGSLASVFCMVGAVHQLRGALSEWGLRALPRLVLTGLFALNPMIWYYAANGMSEALYLFTLIAATRYLSRWVRRGDVRSLVFAATALALCYLAGNEALGSAFLASLVVFLVSLRRSGNGLRARIMISATDVTIFALPFIANVCRLGRYQLRNHRRPLRADFFSVWKQCSTWGISPRIDGQIALTQFSYR